MLDKFDHARGWFLKAESDLSAGKRTLESDGPYDTACFHAQQAAEKYLKGFLALLEQPIPRTHDLVELNQRCAVLSLDWSFTDVEASELTPYAVQLRYDFGFWPDQGTAGEALELAGRVRAVVLAATPKKVHP